MRLRRTVIHLHMWLGLSLGALFVLAGLTGSLLVFYVEIDRLLHPEQAVSGTASLASYDKAMVTLRRDFPDKAGPWRLEVTGKPGAIPARYYNPPETRGRAFAPMMVWLSPDGTRVLRRDYWGDTAMTWIYDLHYRLQLGKMGGIVMGYAGLALFVLLLSGLWAWWPRGRWAKALRMKRGAARSRGLRDLHKLAGLTGFPLLAMLTVTGVMLALPEESDAVLTPVFGTPHAMPVLQSRSAEGQPISPSRAVAIATQAMPQARLAWIMVPGPGKEAYSLRIQQQGDPSRRFPHGFVWIDQYDGAVLAVVSARGSTATTTIDSWLHPLHDGSAGGMVLRVLVALAGLVPLALFVTGWLRWRSRAQP